MQMVALSTTNIRWSESYCFYPLLTLIFGMSTFCSNYSSTSLWHSVNIFPENFNTNVIPCLLQLKPKAFLWMYNRSVKFIFQLAPNLVDGVEVRTLRGPVHYFQCSSRFLLSQVVLAIVRRMFRVIVLLENKSRPNKTTPRWYSGASPECCGTLSYPWFHEFSLSHLFLRLKWHPTP